ncbi:MAG: response regulator [bacterium]|nr:response regulator [bacterium]
MSMHALDQPANHAMARGRLAGAPRILVVDDDPLQRTLIMRAAKSAGYLATAATSCAEAIELLMREQFSCMTLDLGLEDGDGLDVMEQMTKAACQVPVIVISGMGALWRRTSRARARELGIDMLQSFHKPVDLAALRIALANLRSANAGLPNMHWLGEIRTLEIA